MGVKGILVFIILIIALIITSINMNSLILQKKLSSYYPSSQHHGFFRNSNIWKWLVVIGTLLLIVGLWILFLRLENF